MAADTETVIRQSRESYRRFCRLLGTSTVAILVVLALMGLFLT